VVSLSNHERSRTGRWEVHHNNVGEFRWGVVIWSAFTMLWSVGIVAAFLENVAGGGLMLGMYWFLVLFIVLRMPEMMAHDD